MIQTGLFDLEFRCRELEKNGDPLESTPMFLDQN